MIPIHVRWCVNICHMYALTKRDCVHPYSREIHVCLYSCLYFIIVLSPCKYFEWKSFGIVFALLHLNILFFHAAHCQYHRRHICTHFDVDSISSLHIISMKYMFCMHIQHILLTHLLSFYSGLHLCKPLPSLMAHLLLLYSIYFHFKKFFFLLLCVHSVFDTTLPPPHFFLSLFGQFSFFFHRIWFNLMWSIRYLFFHHMTTYLSWAYIFMVCHRFVCVCTFFLLILSQQLSTSLIHTYCYTLLCLIFLSFCFCSVAYLSIYLSLFNDDICLLIYTLLVPDKTKNEMLMLDFVFV